MHLFPKEFPIDPIHQYLYFITEFSIAVIVIALVIWAAISIRERIRKPKGV